MARDEELAVEEGLWDLLQAEVDSRTKQSIERRSSSDRFGELLKSEPPMQYQLLWALQSLPSNLVRIQAEDVIHQLDKGHGNVLVNGLDRDVILEVSRRIRDRSDIIKLLNRLSTGYTASMATSILHQMQIQWRPTVFSHCSLTSTQYDKADWPKLWIQEARLFCCDFCRSLLSEVSFLKSQTYRCDFSESNLDGFSGSDTEFFNCDFAASRLNRSIFKNSKVRNSNFSESSLSDSTMDRTEFLSSNFREACLSKVRIDNCYFESCWLDDADLKNLRATNSIFVRCRLKQTLADGAVFENCNLSELNLEDSEHYNLTIENCSLEEVILTGSAFSGCSFRNSDLRGSKMAEIELQGCDLRGADLRHVVFHFGSTRCGMVGSPYPSHGTRTGFYTDQLEEQYFREPEEIRRAALLNCDLRGANLDGVDFYLVDLSGSILDKHHYKQAIATGALGIG